MDVGVDHPRHDRRRTQVDDARLGWNRDARTDVRDAITADEHDLVRDERTRSAIEETAGSNRDDLPRRAPETCPGALAMPPCPRATAERPTTMRPTAARTRVTSRMISPP